MTRASAWSWKQIADPGIILLAAAIAIVPLLVRGPSCGGDFAFHFTSWHDALNGWRQGVAYPHWAVSANFGAGEPRFVFYPPLIWMLGAVLGLLLPWALVPAALSFLLLGATGLATRALARQMLPEGADLLAGCAVIFCGYPLFNIYGRGGFAEASGGIWIPLLLLYLLRDRNPSASLCKRAFDGSTLPLALMLAGAWLSNAPVGVMASYLLAFMALASALLLRSWAPVVRASVGASLGIGLASLYLLPAAWEQRWVDIRQTLANTSYMVQYRWLFAGHLPWMKPHKMVLNIPTLIAVAMIAVTLGALLFSGVLGKLPKANSPQARRWWIPLASIPFVVLFLMISLSQPVWNLLPKLIFLQFSYRWLVVLQTPMAIFLATALWPAQKRLRIYVAVACVILFVATSAVAGRFLFIPFGKYHPETSPSLPALESALDRGGKGIVGVPEYAPLGANNDLVAIGLPDACLTGSASTVLGELPKGAASTESDDPKAFKQFPVWRPDQHSCIATFSATSNSGGARSENLRIAAKLDHAGFLVLRLRSYPAWRVAVNGRPVESLPQREDGLMAVPVPQGLVDLTVDWATTPDVIAGRWLSGLALLLLAGLWWTERKLRQTRM